MAALGTLLIAHCDEIVQRWYEAWCASPHPHSRLSEVQLKDKLPVQLRIIGEQLREPELAEDVSQMWKVTERLDPEDRVDEGVPIEDVVLGYKLAVDVVRSWIEDRDLDVTFLEFTYFYNAIFELVAELVRRYSAFQTEEKARERAEYLAGIAHQMRSPLSVLALSIQLFEQATPPVDGSLLDRVRRNVHRLRCLVDRVMRLERFKPDELPVKPRRVCPARLIDEIVSEHEPEALRKGLRLDVSVNRTLHANMDPELVRDALGNLVDNAVKYTSSGFVQIEIEEDPDAIIFKVTDSGPGISADRQKELFKLGGSFGIGLVVVHRAVTAQGGAVGVESEPGKGACFWFRLPRDVRARHGEEAANASDQSGGTAT